MYSQEANDIVEAARKKVINAMEDVTVKVSFNSSKIAFPAYEIAVIKHFIKQLETGDCEYIKEDIQRALEATKDIINT